MITLHQDVQEFLNELNEIGQSIVFGGYLRSRIFNETPNDVDIVTNIPIEILEKKYSSMEKAKRRVTTSGHNVFSFKLHKTEKIFVEIISIEGNLFQKSKQADYTINSLMHDGKKVIDTEGSFKDIENRIIKEVDIEIIKEDLKTRPFLWLKTLRLVSMTGFNLSDKSFQALSNNKHCVKKISSEIMKTEGHKTLNGVNPFKTMELLASMGFVSSFEVSDLFQEKRISLQPQQKLCILAILSNKNAVDDFAKFYHLPQKIIDKYEKLYNMYYSDERPPSRFRNQIITIKKTIEGE